MSPELGAAEPSHVGALRLRVAVEGLLVLACWFLAWELLERSTFRSFASEAVRALHIARGVGAALLLAGWAFLRGRQARLAQEATTRAVLSRLEAQLREKERLASLGVLTAGFAHDLGNPLASLSTELELLELDDVPHEVRSSLGVVREHIQRMTRTLGEMVQFARRGSSCAAPVSVGTAIADATRLVGHDPRWRGITLSVDVAGDLPEARIVDDHLVLVLVNLLLNAADAMPRGGHVAVTARARAHAIEIAIADTGHGMAPEVLAQATSPLFTTKGALGTGLGLAVSDGVLRSIGGELRIESEPGQGTVVHLVVPTCMERGIDG